MSTDRAHVGGMEGEKEYIRRKAGHKGYLWAWCLQHLKNLGRFVVYVLVDDDDQL